MNRCADIPPSRPGPSNIDAIPQQCATGETVDGKTPKKLVEEMVPLLYDAQVRCDFLGLYLDEAVEELMIALP